MLVILLYKSISILSMENKIAFLFTLSIVYGKWYAEMGEKRWSGPYNKYSPISARTIPLFSTS